MPPMRTRSFAKYQQQKCSLKNVQLEKQNDKQKEDKPTVPKLPLQRKKLRFKKIEEENQTDEQQNWRKQLAQIIRKEVNRKKEQEKGKQIQSKYPRERPNHKIRSIKIKTKNQIQEAKYQNLCSICLDAHFNIQGLIKCGHKFCFQCIQEWTKSSTNCPCCRTKFTEIIKITFNNQKIQQKRQIIKVQQKVLQINELDYLICLECNNGDDQDVLLICDICDFYCCHVYCDEALNNHFPTDQWYCKFCKQTLDVASQIQRIDIYERTQTLSEIQFDRTSITQTQSLRQNQHESDIQLDSAEDQGNDQCQIRRRMQSQSQKEKRNIFTRSRAQQIFNYQRHISPKNRLTSVIQKITHNTPRTLRNLRRRRHL